MLETPQGFPKDLSQLWGELAHVLAQPGELRYFDEWYSGSVPSERRSWKGMYCYGAEGLFASVALDEGSCRRGVRKGGTALWGDERGLFMVFVRGAEDN